MAAAANNLRKLIVEYIGNEILSGKYSEDCLESLEVAKQCLETAWSVAISDNSDRLLQIFQSVNDVKSTDSIKVEDQKKEASIEDKKSAEMLKSQGNICMGEGNHNDAVSCYTKAIELDPYNAVYYCNRAAAYSKMNKNESAVDDCRKALLIDENYSKAYSRMGLAYSAMNNFTEAIRCYSRALQLEPENQNYQQNLQAAEEKRNASANSSAAGSGPNRFASLMNDMNIGQLLNNPQMMNMAQQFMSQPQMQDMMSRLMQSMVGPTGQAGDTGDSTGSSQSGGQRMDDFLQFGQQLAQQMQDSNPELIESLRQRFHNNSSDPDNENNDSST